MKRGCCGIIIHGCPKHFLSSITGAAGRGKDVSFKNSGAFFKLVKGESGTKEGVS